MEARSIWPWILPFVVFSIFLAVEGWFPDQHYLVYPFRAVAVGAVLLWSLRQVPSIRPHRPLPSTLVGIIGVVAWVGLDPLIVHYGHPPIGRNPFLLYAPPLAWLLFGFRFFGLTLVVPIMEELFWRGFLMRWTIKEDFTSVPLGTFRPFSFFITTAFFASVHGVEWPLAVVVGLLYGGWFIKTRTLGDIMLAHGVTNLLLGLYCLHTGDWHFISVLPSRA